MHYANVIDGEIVKLGPRPNWLIGGDTPEESRPLTDDELAEHGWFRILDAPEHDRETQKLVQIPVGEWVIGDGVVGPQFRVEPLTAEETSQAAHQRWLASFPQAVTRAQAKIALAQYRPDGELFHAAEAAIAALGLEAKLWWSDAETFRFDHPLIEQMRQALELTDEDVAQLFRNAALVL